MYRRFLFDHFREALEDTPVVFVKGPRQVGKSTLVRKLAEQESNSVFVNLDDMTTLSSIKSDPSGYLTQFGDSRIIIDEVQRAPSLFLVIKQLVDQKRTPGKFVLTGSANIFLIPKVADSLAGRMESLMLHPLSVGELLGHQEQFIDRAFDKGTRLTYFEEEKVDVQERALTGGYPEIQTRKTGHRKEAWFHAYLSTILERDIRDIAHIEGILELPDLLKLLATRAGALLNFSEISRTSQFPQTTLKRYYTLLEAVYLIFTLPAWSKNRGKRLVKSPKIYLHDTGVLCHLLGLNKVGFEKNPHLWGKILENFVINELMKISGWSQRVSFYHYRTQSNLEVDIVMERPSGEVVGIEVKASASVHAQDFKGLKALQEDCGKKFVRGIVLYLGDKVVPFGDQFLAIPVPALWV